jgi:hypothetical protein
MSGDMGDDFKAMREMQQEKRARNRESSTTILRDCGVVFSSYNNGVHLVVTHNQVQVDFWPSTGKWIVRDARKTEGRGVYNLIKQLGVRKS